MKCNSTENIEVDHIKPKSIYYRRVYDCTNLQVLCRHCNKEKSILNTNDYRTIEHKNKLEASVKTHPLLKKLYNYKIDRNDELRKRRKRARKYRDVLLYGSGGRGKVHYLVQGGSACRNTSYKRTSDTKRVTCKNCRAVIRKIEKRKNRKDTPKVILRKATPTLTKEEIDYAVLTNHETYMSYDFGIDLACRWFNEDKKDLIAMTSSVRRPTANTKSRALLKWSKVSKGGWVDIGEYKFVNLKDNGFFVDEGVCFAKRIVLIDQYTGEEVHVMGFSNDSSYIEDLYRSITGGPL